MFVYRVRKYIGAYSAALNGRVDALVFSAGIGENSSVIRGMICEDFKVGLQAATWSQLATYCWSIVQLAPFIFQGNSCRAASCLDPVWNGLLSDGCCHNHSATHSAMSAHCYQICWLLLGPIIPAVLVHLSYQHPQHHYCCCCCRVTACVPQGMGISVDPSLNKATVDGAQGDISTPDSRIRVLVIPTDEELSIAQQTLQVVDEIKRKAKVAVAA